MKKKLAILVTAFMILLGSIVISERAFAANGPVLASAEWVLMKLTGVDQQIDALNNKIDQLQAKIDQLQAQQGASQ